MTEKFIISLIEQVDKSSLTEFNFDDGTARLVLRKGGAGLPPAAFSNGVCGGSAAGTAGAGTVSAAGTAGAAAAVPAPDTRGVQASQSGESTDAAPSDASSGITVITSPVVATFYASAAPDSPPFVTKGSRVKKGDTLCVLEAMKMMNHLDAEFDCEIAAVKAASGDLVEYGQALFEVVKI